MNYTLLALSLAAAGAAAETEVHRCPMEDGTVAFQEMPCPEPAAAAGDGVETSESDGETPGADEDAVDFVNPFDAPATPPVEPALPEPVSGDRAECEKTARDAIDAIDAEIAAAGETAQKRLPELLALTGQLRACKDL